ncbi:hypothetical protein [Actinoplanes aureus]|uniref:Uncharacterized protein n=1 Tax=Actinoplanes aureus TaxID=2792083 RepID=A0A931G6I0_9ACTN|nr:hypothetical protein [Actinoplanes aureus]MBG0567254.1 hypothetical protein [Actinoplanes aureus]
MRKQVDQEHWLLWPVRAIAVVVVLPFRLLWEAAKLIGRFLNRYLLAPLAWLWQHLVVIPVLWLAQLIWTAVRIVIGVPLAWLWQQALQPALRALWRYVLRPVFVGVLLAVTFVIERLIAPVGRFVYEWLLAPVGRALLWFLRAGWAGTSWLGRQLYRFLLRPFGIAVAWLWRYTFGALFRGIAWVWGVTVTPAARWVREEILRPAAEAARSVLVAVGLRR